MTYTAWRIPLSLALVLGVAFGFAESGSYYPPADKDGGWRTLFGRGRGRVSDDFNSEPFDPKENCCDLDDHQRLGAAAGQRSFEHLRFL